MLYIDNFCYQSNLTIANGKVLTVNIQYGYVSQMRRELKMYNFRIQPKLNWMNFCLHYSSALPGLNKSVCYGALFPTAFWFSFFSFCHPNRPKMYPSRPAAINKQFFLGNILKIYPFGGNILA